MEKAIVNMTNWKITVHEDRYNLSGTADNHPSLGRNVFVGRTSSLREHSLEDDVLTYETRNTIYKCPLKYLDSRSYVNVNQSFKEELMNRAEKSNSDLDKIIVAAVQIALDEVEEGSFAKYVKDLLEIGQMELVVQKKATEDAMIEIAKQYENSVYIEVSNVDSGDRLAYHIGNYTGIVYPDVHVGMFQDSILYMKYREAEDDCALDFRYFPKGWGDVMETYSWSDNIELAVIKNVSSFAIAFNGEQIQPQETKVFTPEGHCQSLISPDCYNGKSILIPGLEQNPE